MDKSNLSGAATWRSRLFTFFIACFTVVSFFICATATVLYDRPLHPVAAAEELVPQQAETVLSTLTGNELAPALIPVPAEPTSSTEVMAAWPMATDCHSVNYCLTSSSTITLSASHNMRLPMPRHIRGNADDRFVYELTSNVPGDEESIESTSFSAGDRITILLLGIDRRGGGSFVSRTDTMMLLSIHPGRKSVAILSIPRDLYVAIPGYGQDRINTAFVYGSEGDNPAGGAALTIQTVEQNLGVSIDHYVLVNFNAVVRTIDALGGIDINVPYTINDPTFPDMSYGYDPLYISAGLHHFDGATALKYARTRHQDNDFYRAQRQQQLMFAVWRKMLNMGLDDLIREGPVIYRQVSSGVFTDLSLKEILLLAQSASEISTDDIRSEVLDYDYVFDHYSEEGASVLLMNEKAFGLIESMFHDK